MTERDDVWKPLRTHAPQVHFMRLENLVGTGMPDVNGCLNGVEAWIENKLVKGNQIIFQQMQPAWILQRLAHGGRVFVLARRKDDFVLWGGKPLVKLVRGCRTRGDVLVVDHRDVPPSLVLPKPYNWDLLIETLFQRAIVSL